MWHKRINVAVIVLTSLLVVSVAFPLIQQAREAARRTQSKYNLKQIGLALFNYAEAFQGFPPGGVFNPERRGYHGWMTLILPYIDSSPVYISIDFHEPWDFTTNAGIFQEVYPVYENPGEQKRRRHWEFPVAHYSANSHIMAVNGDVKLESIENAERVFLAGELGGDFLPWGCPYNWRELESLNSTPPTYGRYSRDGCLFLFADGRVEFVSNDVSKDILKLMSGDDLTGFKANTLNIQRPTEFPCPSDTLSVSWNYDRDERELVVVKRDIHGKVQSQERMRWK